MSPTRKIKHIQKDTMTDYIKGHQEIKRGPGWLYHPHPNPTIGVINIVLVLYSGLKLN